MANFDDSEGVKTGSHLRTESMSIGDLSSSSGTSTQPSGSSAPANKNDANITWDDVKKLKQMTKMQVWLKGILTAEDAVLAIEAGADAIMVSNHGGRQLDFAPPTLEVLPEIVDAVGGKIPVHFDGGVRRGSDIFKAMCLGADMVWVGRPVLWGLATDGKQGVTMVLKILEQEFKTCMMLAGCTKLSDLNRGLLLQVGAGGRLSKL
jgi:(S)-2-hydroxy-acid oxidase